MSPLNLSKIVFLGIPLSLFDIKIDPIYQHLVGAKHRTKYIKNILGQPVHTKEDIKWYAEENDNKNPKQMRIIQSDSEYESVMPQTQLEKEKQFCFGG